MANQDPALLFYKAIWKEATQLMSPMAKGWYLDLICYQHGQDAIPNDVEQIAVICDVKFSQFESFKTVWNDELKSKFSVSEDGLINKFANAILQSRKRFKEERSSAGKMSSISKKARQLFDNNSWISYVKSTIDLNKIETSDSTSVEQVLQQMLQLYKSNQINLNNTKLYNNDSNPLIQEFKDKANEYSSKYTQEMIDKFCNYWTELTDDGKLKFEAHPKFSFGKRLATWNSRSDNPVYNLTTSDQKLKSSMESCLIQNDMIYQWSNEDDGLFKELKSKIDYHISKGGRDKTNEERIKCFQFMIKNIDDFDKKNFKIPYMVNNFNTFFSRAKTNYDNRNREKNLR